MTFTNLLKALGLLNNGPAPEQCYNPNSTRGTPASATSKGYNHPGYSTPPPLPNVVNGYPVNNNYTIIPFLLLLLRTTTIIPHNQPQLILQN
ncbi:hypothetical protein GBA52_004544 [Prunus armeniaca]|nr:hypothetical protein GBA52_004544 [Prunus armeniaca]